MQICHNFVHDFQESSGEHHVTSKKDKLLLESDISARFALYSLLN